MKRKALISLLLSFFLILPLITTSCSSSNPGGSSFSPPSNGAGRIAADSASSESEDTEKRPENGKVICVDPGHGFRDAGAGAEGHELGPDTNEADVNLSVSKFLKEELERLGYKVYMTHEGEISPDIEQYVSDESYQTFYFDPEERVALINSKNPDYSISLHCNMFNDPSVRGTKLYVFDQSIYTDTPSENVKTAMSIAESLKLVFPDVNDPTIDTQSLALVRDIICNGVLIEMGFVSSPEDAADLIDPEWQKKFARGVANGINEYFFPSGSDAVDSADSSDEPQN